MPLIDDFLSGIYSALYGILSFLAGGLWLFDRLFIMVGYCLMAIDNWLVASLFSPLIQSTNQSLFHAFNAMFLIALLILGITYMISHLIQLNVVTLGKALTWWFFGLLFFTLGPQLYQGMQDLRGGIQTFFYSSVLTQVSSNSGSAFNSLNSVRSTSDYDLPMYAVCDNFSRYLGRTGPDRRTGLDAALAFLRADGIDVMGYAPPGGLPADCDIHVGGIQTFLPAEWFTLTTGNTLGPEMESKEKGSYFASEKAPGSGWWNNTMNVSPVDTINNHRMNTLMMAGTGLMRLVFVQPVIWYGIAEQFVNVLLTIAQALTFISMAIAILFSFFRRTEAIALAVLDQWIQLIIVTMVLAVLSALIAGLFMIGANSGNVFGTFGMSIVALVFTVFMLMVGFKTVYNASNKLFDAIGQATGGSVMSLGRAAGVVAGAAGAVATGGATFLAANAVDDISTQQAAAMGLGAMFSGNQALSGAARMIKMLPGATDTQIGGLVMDMAAGEAFTRMGNAMGGSVGGLIGGGVVLPEYLRQLNRAGMDAETSLNGQRALASGDGPYIDDEGYEYEPPRRPRRPTGGGGPKPKRVPHDSDDDQDDVVADTEAPSLALFDGLAIPKGRFTRLPRHNEDDFQDIPAFDLTDRARNNDQAVAVAVPQSAADASAVALSNEEAEKLDDRLDAEGDQVSAATTSQMINDNRKADRLEQEFKDAATTKSSAPGAGPSADTEAATMQKQDLAIGRFEQASHDLARTAQQMEMNDKLRTETQTKPGGNGDGDPSKSAGSTANVDGRTDKPSGAMSGSEALLGQVTLQGASPYMGPDGVVHNATSVAGLMGRTLATVQQDRLDSDRPIHGAVGVQEGKAALYDAVGVEPVKGLDSNAENRVSVPGWVAPVGLANELGLSPQQLQTAVNDVQTRRDHGLSKDTRVALVETAQDYTNYPDTRVSDLERSIQNLPKAATFKGVFAQPVSITPPPSSSDTGSDYPGGQSDTVSSSIGAADLSPSRSVPRNVPQAIKEMTEQNWATQAAIRQQRQEADRLAEERLQQRRTEQLIAPARDAEAFLQDRRQVEQAQDQAERVERFDAAQAAPVSPQPSILKRVMGDTPKTGGESNLPPLPERPGMVVNTTPAQGDASQSAMPVQPINTAPVNVGTQPQSTTSAVLDSVSPTPMNTGTPVRSSPSAGSIGLAALSTPQTSMPAAPVGPASVHMAAPVQPSAAGATSSAPTSAPASSQPSMPAVPISQAPVNVATSVQPSPPAAPTSQAPAISRSAAADKKNTRPAEWTGQGSDPGHSTPGQKGMDDPKPSDPLSGSKRKL